MVLELFSSQIDLWFLIGFIGMFAATLFPIYRYIKNKNHLKFYVVQIAITGIAAVAYFLMYIGFGVIELNGTEVALTRYADWLLTTPFMVATLAALSKPGRKTVFRLIALDIMVMSVGAVGPFIGFPFYWVLFMFGCLAYTAMMYLILCPVSNGAGLEKEEIDILFTKLRNLTVALWTLYPLVVVLGPQALGLLTVEGQATVVSYLDIISKGVFVVIAVRGVQKIPEISFSFSSEEN